MAARPGTLSGPATKPRLARALLIVGAACFERRARISVSHLDPLGAGPRSRWLPPARRSARRICGWSSGNGWRASRLPSWDSRRRTAQRTAMTPSPSCWSRCASRAPHRVHGTPTTPRWPNPRMARWGGTLWGRRTARNRSPNRSPPAGRLTAPRPSTSSARASSRKRARMPRARRARGLATRTGRRRRSRCNPDPRPVRRARAAAPWHPWMPSRQESAPRGPPGR